MTADAVAGRARLVVARGARATEAAVVARIEELLAAAAAEPALLARPVRVIVPSRSLRLHLAAELVRRRGRPAVGVAVETLHAAALEILERRGGHAAGPYGADARRLTLGPHLAEVLARRFARHERDLSGPLDDLVDGYAAVYSTVRDLLDAGLEPAHAEAADEALAADGPAVATAGEVARARALVRAAARLAAELEVLGVRRTSTLFRRAAELLAADPERALPARAVVVHGFADAPGVTLDLLEGLVRHLGAEVFLDLGAEVPASGVGTAGVDDGAPGGGHPFTARLRERLAGAAGGEVEAAAGRAAGDPGAPAGPVGSRSEAPARQTGDWGGGSAEVAPEGPAALTARGVDAEVREVARRVRARLDGGTRPEAVAVVVRDLERYRLPLRRHLDALAVPFSGVGGRGSLTAAGRRAAALRELLRRKADLAADRWLDAAEGLHRQADGRAGPLAVDLRLAFHSLGAGRLRDIAEVDVDRWLRDGWYYLPVRVGLREAAPDESAEVPAGNGDGASAVDPAGGDRSSGTRGRRSGPMRRRVHGDSLRRAVAAAGAVAARLAGWPATAPVRVHFDRLRTLLADDLGWPVEGEVAGTIAAVEAALPPELELSFDELRLLLDRALDGAGFDPLGGRGGGVQVLSVLEARGRTFDALFLPGLNRGVFPRTVRQDPLLADDLRTVLARVLPDVPIKQRGFDEERYLFAQLLSAAPRVTLSWPAADADGRPLSPSPLVEPWTAGAAAAPPLTALETALGAGTAGRAGGAALRPAREHAFLAALHGPRGRLGRPLAAALAEGREISGLERRSDRVDPAAVAAARLAVLAELDPDRRTPEGRAAAARLGPFFGFVGAAVRGDDPRRRELYVTLLERIAGCPWQLFLERLLGLEPTPDPLLALPGVDPLLLGNLVHRVLETVALRALPEPRPDDLVAAIAGEPAAVPWPPAVELRRTTAEAAARLVEDEGVPLPGIARALVERALPFLDEARRADWSGPGGRVPALAVEVAGSLAVRDGSGGERALRFKADRVDSLGGDARTGVRLRLTDFKTGKPVSEAKTARTHRDHLLQDVRAGRRLQAVAYALAGAAAGLAAEGRYLFLKPDIPQREFAVAAGDAEMAAAFAAAVAAALDAWDAGVFVPRVVDAAGQKEPLRCSWCEVADACLRGDSGARRRIAEWTARRGAAAESAEDGAGSPASDPADAALLAVWRLGVKERDREPRR